MSGVVGRNGTEYFGRIRLKTGCTENLRRHALMGPLCVRLQEGCETSANFARLRLFDGFKSFGRAYCLTYRGREFVRYVFSSICLWYRVLHTTRIIALIDLSDFQCFLKIQIAHTRKTHKPPKRNKRESCHSVHPRKHIRERNVPRIAHDEHGPFESAGKWAICTTECSRKKKQTQFISHHTPASENEPDCTAGKTRDTAPTLKTHLTRSWWLTNALKYFRKLRPPFRITPAVALFFLNTQSGPQAAVASSMWPAPGSQFDFESRRVSRADSCLKSAA